jgi:hypothetical protein
MTESDYKLILDGKAKDSCLGDYKDYDCSWEAGFAVDYYENGVILFNYQEHGGAVEPTLLILDKPAISLLVDLLKKRGYLE